MKIKDIIKKQTTIIAIAVILVTIAVIGVSYALFFSVNKNTEDQVITAGNLALTVSGLTAGQINNTMSEAEGLASTPITYTVENTNSNLPAVYSLYVYGGIQEGETQANTIPLESIMFSTDGTTAKKLVDPQTSIQTDNSQTAYLIDSGKIEAGGTAPSKSLRIWIDESLLSSEIEGGNLNLQLYIVSEVDEG